MDPVELRCILSFLRTEEELASRFGIPTESILPMLFSLRFGGDWCYAGAAIATISVVKKTTVYDAGTQVGYSREEIFLLVNPEITQEEGTVHRLEKCGSLDERVLVTRPYRVRVRAERIIRMTIHPVRRTIGIEEFPEQERDFEGSSAYDIAHEMEHIKKKEISGEPLYTFTFVQDFIRNFSGGI